MVPPEKKNPISLQFPLQLSLLLHPFLYPWQVIISPINPASFIPALWSSLLREKLIVISSQFLPESFLPERVVEKWKVKIVAQYVTAASGSPGGKYKLGKQNGSHQNISEECVREGAERQGLSWAFHQDKIEPIPCCCMVSWKRRATFEGGSCGFVSFCRRLQIEVPFCSFWYKREQCAGLVLNCLDRSEAMCLLAKHE